MGKKSKPRTRVDLFLENLRSEITAGNAGLSAWLKHLQSVGGIERLFELEVWLRGLQAFFDPGHIPVRESERPTLSERGFHHELRIVRQVMQRSSRIALEVAQLGQPANVRLETLVERKSRRPEIPGCNVDAVLEQGTPVESLEELQECLKDSYLLINALGEARIDYQVYFSLGKRFRRELKACRFIEMLLSERIREQYDQMDNAFLRGILDSLKDAKLKRSAALSFLYMHRLLKYLALIARELEQDRPLRETLVIFALIHVEMASLGDFLKGRFLKAREADNTLRESVELIAYSLRAEGRRTQEQELASVALETDASTVFARVQNSHGLLRNCLQSGVVTLAQALNRQVEAQHVYPSMMDGAKKAQVLRQDLWELRVFLKEMLDTRQEPPLEEIVRRMSEFREKSLPMLMYRDWSEFESFTDSIVTAGAPLESRVLLRKFIGYIETLVQEVSKRSSFSQKDAASIPGQ